MKDGRDANLPPSPSSVAGELQLSAVLLVYPQNRDKALEKISAATYNTGLLSVPDLQDSPHDLTLLLESAKILEEVATEADVTIEGLRSAVKEYFQRIPAGQIPAEVFDELFSTNSHEQKVQLAKGGSPGGQPDSEPKQNLPNAFDRTVAKYTGALVGRGSLCPEDLAPQFNNAINTAINRLSYEAKAKPSGTLRLLVALLRFGGDEEKR